MRGLFFFVVATMIMIATALGIGGDMGVGTEPLTDGSEDYPWLIEDVSDFNIFASDPNYWHGHIRLEDNITLSSYNNAVVAPYSEDGLSYFSGVFDGNYHQISNLRIECTNESYLGLFGVTANCTIKNLNLVNVEIGDPNSYSQYVGGIAGDFNGWIENCHVKGTVRGYRRVGLLAGSLSARVISCYTEGLSQGNTSMIGGLCGEGDGYIHDCYSEARVEGDNLGNSYLGGLCGDFWNGMISNCYAAGSVICGDSSSTVGGLVGLNNGSISNCFATGNVLGGNRVEKNDSYGGFCGSNRGDITNCFATGMVICGDYVWYVGSLCGINYGEVIDCHSSGSVSTGVSPYMSGGIIGNQAGEYNGMTSLLDVLSEWDYVGTIKDGIDDYWIANLYAPTLAMTDNSLDYFRWIWSSGDFNDNSKWDTNIVPSAVDNAMFEYDTFYTVTLTSNTTINNMAVLDGTFTIDLAGHALNINELLVSGGKLIVVDGTFEASGIYVVEDGTLEIDNSTVEAVGEEGLVITDGTLSGLGCISGNVFNYDTIQPLAPAEETGLLSKFQIDGNLTNNEGSKLQFDISNVNGVNNPLLEISGFLNGLPDEWEITGSGFERGDEFELVKALAIKGQDGTDHTFEGTDPGAIAKSVDGTYFRVYLPGIYTNLAQESIRLIADPQVVSMEWGTEVPVLMNSVLYHENLDLLTKFSGFFIAFHGTMPGEDPNNQDVVMQKVRNIFDLSRVENIVITGKENIPAGLEATKVYFSKLTSDPNKPLYGYAFDGIDQYNQSRTDGVVVDSQLQSFSLPEGFDGDHDQWMANTIAHELGHSFGLVHTFWSDGFHNVMDYVYQRLDFFTNVELFHREPPLPDYNHSQYTQNAQYHLRRYIDNETDDYLRLEALVIPGGFDVLDFSQLGINASGSAIASLGVLKVIAMSGMCPSQGMIVAGEFDVEGGSDVSFTAQEGSVITLLASSSSDGPMDMIFTLGDPTVENNLYVPAEQGTKQLYLVRPGATPEEYEILGAVTIDTDIAKVDLEDLALLGKYWQMDNCISGTACAEVDWYVDGKVDILDLQLLAEYWLSAEIIPYTPPVKLFNDDFETGDFSNLEWQFTGDADWEIVSDVVYEGICAAKSGAISDSQQSAMEFSIDTEERESISFYSKVSSESDYDDLKFYIDDVEQDNWSGEIDWALQTYTFIPGVHTFKWSFEKDGSVSNGSDCGWIDDIRIFSARVPILSGLSQSEAEAAITGNGLTVGTITQDYSETVAAGYVISQSPDSGELLLPGDPVDFVVSLGPGSLFVPDLSGLTQTEAELAIVNAGFVVGTVTQTYSDTITIGCVIGQLPLAGEPATAGSNINLVISLGPEPVGPNITWVAINDPGVAGHEGFVGEMSKYETTNALYCEFLNAAITSGDIIIDGDSVLGAAGTNSGADYANEIYYNLAGAGSSIDGAINGGAARINFDGALFTVDSGFENHPVSFVTWYGASAFVNYYGYRLPTEWEWQAVADYDGTFTYGCGAGINNTCANYSGSSHPDGTANVGDFGTYGYGICDMSGNIREWTSTISGSFYVFRGGHWVDSAVECSVSGNGVTLPYAANHGIGFRVCR